VNGLIESIVEEGGTSLSLTSRLFRFYAEEFDPRHFRQSEWLNDANFRMPVKVDVEELWLTNWTRQHLYSEKVHDHAFF
jgi:hypothetical protein